MKHYSKILVMIAAGLLMLSFDSCKKDEPQSKREEVSIFSDDFNKPDLWSGYETSESGYVSMPSSEVISSGLLSLSAVQGEGCDRKRVEREFDVTAEIQEILNTNDTLFFDMTIKETGLTASGYLSAVFQFNNLNLRFDLLRIYTKPTDIRVVLVNWVVVEVTENGLPVTEYYITASKGTEANSGAIIAADACGADLYADASIVMDNFQLSFPLVTVID